MILTPKSVVVSAAPADPALVIVVCHDEHGNVHNHYINDSTLKATYASTVSRQRAEIVTLDIATLRRAAREIEEAAAVPRASTTT